MNSRVITTMAAAALFTTGCVHLNRASDVYVFRDPEVAMGLGVANLAEGREGNFARDRATAQAVNDFASMISSEHAQAASKNKNRLSLQEVPSVDPPLRPQSDAASAT